MALQEEGSVILLKLFIFDFTFRRHWCSNWSRGRAVRFHIQSLSITHVCQTCVVFLELRSFHLDDSLRNNVAVVPLQGVLVGMNAKSFIEPSFFCGNAGVKVTWGWTILLVIVEAGLALIHQYILEDPLHSHDGQNIL